MTNELFIWLAIALCITQSAIFSGLNIAYFSLSRLQLEVEAKQGNPNAKVILDMRKDSNFLLSTILWGNVSINVLLTLLSDSVLAGVYSFLFSAIAITFLGEIFPQAYFSRNALRVASVLTPVIKMYQILLYPVAKLTALILDGWLGREGISYFREQELSALIGTHMEAEEADMDHVQGMGALNFFEMDKSTVCDEGEVLDPQSVVRLATKLDLPLLPNQQDPEFADFINTVNKSGHKWVILASEANEPLLVMDVDGFVRATVTHKDGLDPYQFCHRPLVIDDPTCSLSQAVEKLRLAHTIELQSNDVLHSDVLLVWTDNEQRIITGADILGRLFKGIGSNVQS
jgi:metal transporter CNNM